MRFRLRTLLIIVTLAAGVLGYIRWRTRPFILYGTDEVTGEVNEITTMRYSWTGTFEARTVVLYSDGKKARELIGPFEERYYLPDGTEVTKAEFYSHPANYDAER
jgi:hypothetical protein